MPRRGRLYYPTGGTDVREEVSSQLETVFLGKDAKKSLKHQKDKGKSQEEGNPGMYPPNVKFQKQGKGRDFKIDSQLRRYTGKARN